ncbi:WXG100 family type VII secretion target [Kitasatospora purpeofusca]|uniref:WXG100 family type VII secretion target n=1 Tax=Kitasatospora purpeofusca TaxID=67352 RepID=UPI0030EFC1FE
MANTNPNAVTKADPASIQAVKSTIESQMGVMDGVKRDIDMSIQELETKFQAKSSVVFVQKIGEWQQKYQEVIGLYNDFLGKLAAGENTFNSAEENALSVANKTGSGGHDPIKDALNPPK